MWRYMFGENPYYGGFAHHVKLHENTTAAEWSEGMSDRERSELTDDTDTMKDVDVPPEFEECFKKNWKDILA